MIFLCYQRQLIMIVIFCLCTASGECTQHVAVDEEATYSLEEPVTQLVNLESSAGDVCVSAEEQHCLETVGRLQCPLDF